MDVTETPLSVLPLPTLEQVDQAVEAGSWEYARGLLALLVESAPPDATHAARVEHLRHRIETTLVAEQDWADATARWRAALTRFPNQAALWPFAARCFIQANAHEDAEGVLVLISKAQPDNVDNWIYAAINAEHLHRWSDAVERWNRVVALRPTDPNMKTLRGHAIWNAEMLATEDLVGE